MSSESISLAPSRSTWALTLGVFALVAGVWLTFTPPGLLGKADAIGYAICHRIDLRSFHIGERPLPLCARCTGIYLGALFSMVTLALLGRQYHGGLPPTRFLVVLVGFIGLMGIDGLNSYAKLFPGLPNLYEPNNTLRMITGTLNGLAVGVLIYPVFNQTLWRQWESRPVISHWRELGLLVLVAAGLMVLVLTENPIVLYPLAILSSLGVLLLLSMLYTIGLLIFLRRENQVTTWRQAAWPLLIGLTLAIVQIAAIDAVRYSVFGTWAGLPLGG